MYRDNLCIFCLDNLAYIYILSKRGTILYCVIIVGVMCTQNRKFIMLLLVDRGPTDTSILNKVKLFLRNFIYNEHLFNIETVTLLFRI